MSLMLPGKNLLKGGSHLPHLISRFDTKIQSSSGWESCGRWFGHQIHTHGEDLPAEGASETYLKHNLTTSLNILSIIICSAIFQIWHTCYKQHYCVLVYLEWLPEKRSEFHVLWGLMLDGLVFARTDGATMMGTRILDKFYSQPAILPGCWKYKCNEIWYDVIGFDMTSCSLIRYDIGICLDVLDFAMSGTRVTLPIFLATQLNCDAT